MHDLDRKAFDALNTFPKLVKLREAYSANYDEKAAIKGALDTPILTEDGKGHFFIEV